MGPTDTELSAVASELAKSAGQGVKLTPVPFESGTVKLLMFGQDSQNPRENEDPVFAAIREEISGRLEKNRQLLSETEAKKREQEEIRNSNRKIAEENTFEKYRDGLVRCKQRVIALEDRVYDCHSFTTLEDLTATYSEINYICGGLLIIKDEDDGRYDPYA